MIPNITHCSSSQAFDELSKTLRMMALLAETSTTMRISQDTTLPIRKLSASMTRLSLSNAAKCDPPAVVPCGTRPPGYGPGLSMTAKPPIAGSFPDPSRHVNWKFGGHKGIGAVGSRSTEGHRSGGGPRRRAGARNG